MSKLVKRAIVINEFIKDLDDNERWALFVLLARIIDFDAFLLKLNAHDETRAVLEKSKIFQTEIIPYLNELKTINPMDLTNDPTQN